MFAYAYRRSQVVATVNVGDFINLAHQSDLHPGVIALREAALKHAERTCNGDLTNAVVHQIPDHEGEG